MFWAYQQPITRRLNVYMANGTSKQTVSGPPRTYDSPLRSTICHIHIHPPDDGLLIRPKHVQAC
jgi:hypothetical protein